MSVTNSNDVFYSRTNATTPLDQSLTRTLAWLGVNPFSTADQTQELQIAFSIAANEGFKVLGHPDAVYRKNGPVEIRSSFDGQGATFIAGESGPQRLWLHGNGLTWRNFTHLGAASARADGAPEKAGISIDNTTDFVLENVHVGSIDPDSASVKHGFAAAGIQLVNVKRGVIIKPVVKWNLADGINLTNSCEDIDIYSPDVEGSGDDGVAVVSYANAASRCKRINTFGGVVRDIVGGRGWVIAGAEDCVFNQPSAIRTAGAGHFIISQNPPDSPSQSTHGSRACRMVNAHSVGCVTGVGQPSNFSQAAAVIYGRPGTAMVDGVPTYLGTEDCVIDVSVFGLGARGTAAADYSSEHNIRPMMIVRVKDIKGPEGSSFNPLGFKAGGFNGRLQISGSGVPGHLGEFVGGAASGIHRIEIVGMSDIRTGPSPINCVIYTEGANNITALYLTGELTNAPNALLGDIAGFGAKIRKRDLWLNGTEVPS